MQNPDAHPWLAQPGFRTPSMLFGPDFVLGLPGVERTDEEAAAV